MPVWSVTSPTTALHAGLAWAVAGDADELGALIRSATNAFSCSAEVLVPVLKGLLAQVEGRSDAAADLIQQALPKLEEARLALTRQMDRGRTVPWVPQELAVPG